MTTIAPATAAPPTNSTSAANGTSNSGTLNFTQNFNTFLTLLTTQLQNQDPLSPLDTNQFTQQLVSFSEVEQQINTNNNLQQLIQLQTANATISALPLVGHTIQYNSPTAPLANGAADFSYTLPTAAANVALSVVDAQGNVVYSGSGGTAAGQHGFVWNGQTNAGVQLPDGGSYTLEVTATDSTNAPITATVQSSGQVDRVSIANGQANFDVSGITVPMSELVTIDPSTTN